MSDDRFEIVQEYAERLEALVGLAEKEFDALRAENERLHEAYVDGKMAEDRDQLLAENERLRSALKEIADDPHQVYGRHAGSLADRRYGIGVADGHRCAARAARAALGEGGDQ